MPSERHEAPFTAGGRAARVRSVFALLCPQEAGSVSFLCVHPSICTHRRKHCRMHMPRREHTHRHSTHTRMTHNEHTRTGTRAHQHGNSEGTRTRACTKERREPGQRQLRTYPSIGTRPARESATLLRMHAATRVHVLCGLCNRTICAHVCVFSGILSTTHAHTFCSVCSARHVLSGAAGLACASSGAG